MALKVIANNVTVDIQAGDWVRTLPGYFDSDPYWGNCFKVISIHDSYLLADMIVPGTTEYAPSGVSYEVVTEVHRKVEPQA